MKVGNTPNPVPNPPTTPTPSTVSLTIPLSHLTDEEKNLLWLHLMCFKCCIFYAGHLSHNCNNPHSTSDDCRKVTAANTTKAKATYEKKNSITTIVAVLTGGATFGDSDSDEGAEEWIDANKAKEYVTPCFDLPAHLLWMCCLDAPATCAPIPVNTLIDHGSPPVLISSDLAELLCLTP